MAPTNICIVYMELRIGNIVTLLPDLHKVGISVLVSTLGKLGWGFVGWGNGVGRVVDWGRYVFWIEGNVRVRARIGRACWGKYCCSYVFSCLIHCILLVLSLYRKAD
jgi:hypothetical protein